MRRLIAAGFGSGFVPRWIRGSDTGAGTVGALLAAVVALALWPLPLWAHLVVTVVFVGLSLWAPVPYLIDDPDPAWVVIDEMAGAMLALSGLRGLAFVVAFVVFRLADIFKWLPGVNQAERLPGSVGVTADDLVAGVYGLVCGLIVAAITG